MKAIVTGHTRGLGAAIAEQLLARGIAVLGLARSGNTDLATRYPDLFNEIALDLAGEAVTSFIAGAPSLLLINNAGMLQPVGPLAQQDASTTARTVSLNVAAPLTLSSAIAAQMAGRPLRILHVSSGAASIARRRPRATSTPRPSRSTAIPTSGSVRLRPASSIPTCKPKSAPCRPSNFRCASASSR